MKLFGTEESRLWLRQGRWQSAGVTASCFGLGQRGQGASVQPVPADSSLLLQSPLLPPRDRSGWVGMVPGVSSPTLLPFGARGGHLE